jgi:hypothetical protein
MAFMCAGSFLRANIPACTFGCNVLTRPSSISGKPVISETSTASTPLSFSSLYVPPVDIISTPADASSFAKSTIPSLSETLMIALLIFTSIIPPR